MFGFGRGKAETLSKEEEKKVNEKFESFKNRAYSEDDMHKALGNEDSILKKMNNKSMADFLEDVKTFFSMLKDFFTKRYTDVPVGTIMAIAGSLLYVLSPIDLIPDFLPVIGMVDDAAIIALCLKFVQADLEKYRQFKGL